MKWATYVPPLRGLFFWNARIAHLSFQYNPSTDNCVGILRDKVYCHIEFLRTRTIPYCLSPKCLGECDVTLTQVHVFQEGRKNPPPVKLLHTFLASQKPIHKSKFMNHYIYERINFHYEDKQYQFPKSCLVLETLFCRCKGLERLDFVFFSGRINFEHVCANAIDTEYKLKRHIADIPEIDRPNDVMQ